jgi:hypothetical protein
MEIERPRSGRNGRMNGQFFILLGHGVVIRRCIYAKRVVDFFKLNTSNLCMIKGKRVVR